MLDYRKKLTYYWYTFRGAGQFGLSSNNEFLTHRTNGLTHLMVSLGIPFSIFYFIIMFFSIKNYVKLYIPWYSFSYIFFICVLILGLAQTVFLRPFFISLLFLPSTFARK